MSRRRALFVVTVAAFVACAAPYRIADLGADGDAGADASTNIPIDSSVTDATSPGDAPEPLDATATSDADVARDAGAPSCDQDEDGFLAERDGCGGNDCDDLDPRTRPDAGFVNTPPREGGTGGDFNCDGVVAYEYTPDFTCSGLAVTGCSTNVGYIGSPACGEAAELNKCAVSSLNCVVQATVSTAQGCR